MADDEHGFIFVGENLCLDFVNTRSNQNGQPVYLLDTLGDFLDWLVVAGVLSLEDQAVLAQQWADDADRIMEDVNVFHAALTTMVQAIMEDQSVDLAGVALINHYLATPNHFTQIKAEGGGFSLEHGYRYEQPAHLLYPIAEAACDLLIEGDLKRVKQCENPTCILHFYDTSKNHSRRWCSMSTCGNQMKVAAYYARQRAKRKKR